MASNARQSILEAAARLIHHRGYNHTGLQDILREAGVPKGSFYYYFKSKEDLVLQLVDLFGSFWQAQAHKYLDREDQPPLIRLRQLFQSLQEHFRQQNFQAGCPVGNLAQEMGDLSPVLGDKLRQAIDSMAQRVAGVLAQARQTGALKADEEDLAGLAYFIISSWQGALIRMKVAKSAEPLETFDKVVFERLLA